MMRSLFIEMDTGDPAGRLSKSLFEVLGYLLQSDEGATGKVVRRARYSETQISVWYRAGVPNEETTVSSLWATSRAALTAAREDLFYRLWSDVTVRELIARRLLTSARKRLIFGDVLLWDSRRHIGVPS